MSIQLVNGNYSCIDSRGVSKTIDYRPLGHTCDSRIPAENNQNDSGASTGLEQNADDRNIQSTSGVVQDDKDLELIDDRVGTDRIRISWFYQC